VAIDFAGDMPVFFNAAEFGEAITYDDGAPFVAIWNRPGDLVSFGRGEVATDRHSFIIQAVDLPAPLRRGVIRVVRTGEAFTICEDPLASSDGRSWTVHAS
jgi:hypothetical protein